MLHGISQICNRVHECPHKIQIEMLEKIRKRVKYIKLHHESQDVNIAKGQLSN